MALLIHILMIVSGFVGPLVVWLIRKDRSPFVDAHGRTALDFALSMIIYTIGAAAVMFVLVGRIAASSPSPPFSPVFFFLPVLFLLMMAVLPVIFGILGAVRANAGQMYRYPLALPFFSRHQH